MPWVRIDEHALNHVKILALSHGAFRLWVEGLAHCQKHLTDGAIGRDAVRTFRYAVRARVDELTAAGLWETTDDLFRVHDYLQWNESRVQVLQARQTQRQRFDLFKNPELRQEIRDRDGDWCRYCGETVRWNDRRGPLSGTYDHVQPYAGNDLANLVVSCRSCNSRKSGRTPDEAGMKLLEPKTGARSGSKSELESFKQPHHVHTTKEKIKSTAAPRRAVEISEGTFALYAKIAAEARDFSMRQDGDESISNIAAIFKSLCANRKLRYDGELAGKAIEAVLTAAQRSA